MKKKEEKSQEETLESTNSHKIQSLREMINNAEKTIQSAKAMLLNLEGKKKTGTPLCARGKAAAKSKFDVYPSAYANGYAVQVCKGTKPGLDGKKRCSGAYC